jgi:hypothetical protein
VPCSRRLTPTRGSASSYWGQGGAFFERRRDPRLSRCLARTCLAPRLEHRRAGALPYIATSRGYCFGVGFELALACDFRLVSETCLYSLPEQRLGQIPGSGGAARLQKMVGITRVAFSALCWLSLFGPFSDRPPRGVSRRLCTAQTLTTILRNEGRLPMHHSRNRLRICADKAQ